MTYLARSTCSHLTFHIDVTFLLRGVSVRLLPRVQHMLASCRPNHPTYAQCHSYANCTLPQSLLPRASALLGVIPVRCHVKRSDDTDRTPQFVWVRHVRRTVFRCVFALPAVLVGLSPLFPFPSPLHHGDVLDLALLVIPIPPYCSILVHIVRLVLSCLVQSLNARDSASSLGSDKLIDYSHSRSHHVKIISI